MFIVKEVAKNLGITPQAIYKQKEDLQQKGFMFKNNANDWEITAEGYNYLMEKRINQTKQQNAGLNEVTQKNIEKSSKNDSFGLNETLVNLYENRISELKESYENQIRELKQQVDYFKSQYEDEKSERKQANAQYQALLGTAEDNKRHWWQFRKNNNNNIKE